LANVQLIEQFRIWIVYGVDEKIRIGSGLQNFHISTPLAPTPRGNVFFRSFEVK